MNQTPTYLVPKNTAAVLRDYQNKCRHLGLFLGRYTPRQVIAKKDWETKRTKWRDHWLKNDVLPRFDTKEDALSDLQAAVYARWQKATAQAETFQARSKSRLIVGLGGKGVLEVGITLHHVTGLPIIPGSALKGLTRTYALLHIAAEARIRALNLKQLQQIKEKDARLPSPLEILDAWLVASDEQRKKTLLSLIDALAKLNFHDEQAIDKLRNSEQAQHYRKAFGSQEDGGDCVFYDAVIAGLPPDRLFELDVMTPHFVSYYRDEGSSPPHDGDNPNPVSFVTVAAGTTFAFAVAPRADSDPDVVRQAASWLKQALAELGVGAKTAAGYGVFEVLE